MPTVDVPKPARWGCDCTDYTFHPHEHQISARLPGMLKRAADVKVIWYKSEQRREGWREWTIWTFETFTEGKATTHNVAFNPQGEGGGLCVHCVACLPYIVGEWFRELIGREK